MYVTRKVRVPQRVDGGVRTVPTITRPAVDQSYVPSSPNPTPATATPGTTSSPQSPSPFERRAVGALGPLEVAPFRQDGDSDDLAALQRYAWDTAVGAALWPTIRLVHAALRARLESVVIQYHGSRITGYRRIRHWADGTPSLLYPTDREIVERTIDEMQRDGRQLGPAALARALPFRFWTRLLGTHYESQRDGAMLLWPAAARLVAVDAAGRFQTRDALEQRFEAARTLRNWVAHHEPLAGRPDIAQRYKDLVEGLSWLSRDLARIVRRNPSFWPAYEGRGAAYTESLRDAADASRTEVAPAGSPPAAR